MGVQVSGAAVSDVWRAGHAPRGQVSSESIHEDDNQESSEQASMIPDAEELQRQADGINDMLEANYTDLKFNIHDKLERVFVQVLDRDTDKVIREIPPEKFLDMKAAILEQVGLLVDEKA